MKSNKSVFSIVDKLPNGGWRAILAFTLLGRKPIDLGDGTFSVLGHPYQLVTGRYRNNMLPVYIDTSKGEQRVRLYAKIGHSFCSVILGGGNGGQVSTFQTESEINFGASIGNSLISNPATAMHKHVNGVLVATLPGIAAQYGSTVTLGDIEPFNNPKMPGAVRSALEWNETPGELVIPCAVALLVHFYNVIATATLQWDRDGTVG